MYTPLYIKAPEGGLIQNRQNFILPNDAYPVLENAYVWREQLRRKSGAMFLGRLSRTFTTVNYFLTTASTWSFNLLDVSGYVANTNTANPGQVTTTAPHGLTTGDMVIITGIVGATGYNNVTFTITVVDALNFTVGVNAGGFGAYVSGGYWISNRPLATATTTPLENHAEIKPGSVTVVIAGPITLQDQGNGTLTSATPGTSGTINYVTGAVVITHTAGAGIASTLTYTYYPSLPVMGAPSQELNAINNESNLYFDQKYAYIYNNPGFSEYLPGTVWSGSDSNFFWSMNYWEVNQNKLLWVTNFSQSTGDPIRYTDTVTWTDFAPQIDAAGDVLAQCLALVPFRGYTIAFNTWEGMTLAGSVNYPQRIRWSQLGTPLPTEDVNAWRDDIIGKGGFFDIPTAQDIISVGFVRDNLVIYCERSTWQLRYTGRATNPFQLEKVNTELGSGGTFSSVQFDTTLTTVGTRGIIECDSYQAKRIDIKILDLVFHFQNANNGPHRVYGVRDYINKLAFWSYPFGTSVTYPNRRLVYNYENDSWAIFIDSYTCYGNYQPQSARKWNNTFISWEQSDFPWSDPAQFVPLIVGGNQQGFVMVLDQMVSNQPSLSITGITGNTTTPTTITVVNHNLETGAFISIQNIPATTPFSNLNGMNFQVNVVNANNLALYVYNPLTGEFDDQLDSPATYIGGGTVLVRDNFSIISKKFNFLEEGKTIQLGFIDVLLETTSSGAITLNVFSDYNETNPINQNPSNPDAFFNTTLPTYQISGITSTKNIQRIYCNTRGSFITLQWTLSDAQMVGVEQESFVEIDMQILYLRRGGSQLINNP